MKIPRRQVLRLGAGAAAFTSVSLRARAQSYPTRPVTMVVPLAAGGPTDKVGRILAEGMQKSLGQPVTIQNVAGANGSSGAGRVAAAAGDGYTLVLGSWNTHVINGAMYSLKYDLLNDFEPISLVTKSPHLIVAGKTTTGDDLKSFIAWLKNNPDIASVGTPAVGSAGHLYGLLFKQETGTKFVLAPYQASARAMQDLLSGQIDLLIDSILNTLPQVRAGSIKAYAVTSESRFPQAPDVPTVDEAGLPKLHFSVWSALFAPKGTPTDVITKLNSAAVASLSDPGVRRRLVDLGQEVTSPTQQTPEALRALQRADINEWWPIIKGANIKAE